MQLKWKPFYRQLPNDEDDDEKSDIFSKGNSSKHGTLKFFFSTLLPWLLTLVFASLALIEHLLRKQVLGVGSYATGWKTDMAAARPHIRLEQVRFTGAPAFDDDGKSYIPHPDPIDYFGDGPEVDQAWEELTGGRYIRISEEEAHDAWGEDIAQFWEPMADSYVAGLDMFHSLHCLNRIRKLTVEALIDIQNDHNSRAHHNHCLTQIRQYIMCAGDMTMVPTRHYPGIGRNYIDSDVVHTCRNFEDLRNWLWGRYNGTLHVRPTESRRKIV